MRSAAVRILSKIAAKQSYYDIEMVARLKSPILSPNIIDSGTLSLNCISI